MAPRLCSFQQCLFSRVAYEDQEARGSGSGSLTRPQSSCWPGWEAPHPCAVGSKPQFLATGAFPWAACWLSSQHGVSDPGEGATNAPCSLWSWLHFTAIMSTCQLEMVPQWEGVNTGGWGLRAILEVGTHMLLSFLPEKFWGQPVLPPHFVSLTLARAETPKILQRHGVLPAPSLGGLCRIFHTCIIPVTSCGPR